MAPHVAEAGGAEQRIAQRVAHGVAVGVAGEATGARHQHTAEHERPALDEPVRIQPVADPQRHDRAASSARSTTRSRGCVTLKLSGLPATM